MYTTDESSCNQAHHIVAFHNGAILKELMVTPAAKREAVGHLRSAFDMSGRRACRTIGCVRMTVRYLRHTGLRYAEKKWFFDGRLDHSQAALR
jgi:hypothetical protein